MANRFPLIVDTDDGNRIKEMPQGDLLDMTGSGIANLTTLSVGGSLTANSLSVSTNATISQTLSVTGNTSLASNLDVSGTTTLASVAADSLTVNGESIIAQVQSDWEETNIASAAFILNKPDLSNIGIETLDDIGDVFVADATVGQVLTYDGVSWQADDVASSGTGINSVVTNPPSGTGSLLWNAVSGVLTYTPPSVPTTLQSLSNDPGGDPGTYYADVNYLTDNQFMQPTDLQIGGTADFTRSVDVNGVVTLQWNNNTGYITIADAGLTLDLVATNNGLTSADIETSGTMTADVFVQAAGSTLANSFPKIDTEEISVLTSITGTGGAGITMPGTIQGSTLTGETVNATTTANINLLNVTTGVIQNTSGDLQLETGTGGAVRIEDGLLRIGITASLPASPQNGDIVFDGTTMYYYVLDTGEGSAGFVSMPSSYSPYGLNLPTQDGTTPANPVTGSMFYDINDSKVKVYNGTSWVIVGP